MLRSSKQIGSNAPGLELAKSYLPVFRNSNVCVPDLRRLSVISESFENAVKRYLKQAQSSKKGAPVYNIRIDRTARELFHSHG